MREIISAVLRVILGLGAGFVVSGGVVAFISIIGLLPLMAHRTKTGHHMMWYENAIIIGSILGSILSMWTLRCNVWPFIVVILFFAFGIFIGGLIIALAEVLDVFPIMNRRVKIKKGVSLLVVALALGKLIGSLYYWIHPLFQQVIQ